MIRRVRTAALVAITVIVAASTLTAFAESYRALADFARAHLLTGIWGYAAPLMIDSFMAVGELSLFVALADRLPRRVRVTCWAVVGGGLVVSVAGNVGRVLGHSVADDITAAVPPVAAVVALAVGMTLFKAIMLNPEQAKSEQEHALADSRAKLNGHAEMAQERFAGELAAGAVPGTRRIKAELGVGTERAMAIRDYLRELVSPPV